MPFDASKSRDSENGFAVKGGSGLFSGQGKPMGADAPLGALYIDVLTGSHWNKCGPGVNDWEFAPRHAVSDVKECHKIPECEEMRVSGLRISEGSLRVGGTLRISD